MRMMRKPVFSGKYKGACNNYTKNCSKACFCYSDALIGRQN